MDSTALLRVVAAFDGPASVTELVAVTTRPAAEVVEAVTTAVQEGLLVETPSGPDFPTDAQRSEVQEGIGPSSMRALRLAAAKALADSGGRVDRVAGLLILAEEHLDAWALSCLTDHADVLVHRHPAQAAVLLERSLRTTAAGPRLRRLWVRALLWSGQTDSAREHASALLAVPEFADELFELRLILAEAALMTFDLAAVSTQLTAARTVAPSAEHSARIQVIDSVRLLLEGDVAAAADLLGADMDVRSPIDDGLAVQQLANRPTTDSITVAYRLQVSGTACYLWHRYDRGVRLLESAAAVLDTGPGDPMLMVHGRLMLAECLSAVDPDRARAVVESARPTACLIGAGLRPWLHVLAAELDSRAGRWEAALAEVREALALDNTYGFERVLRSIHAEVALLRGDLLAGREQMWLAEEACERSSPLAAFYESHAVIADTLLAEREGRDTDALNLTRRVAREGLGAHPSTSIVWLAPVLVRIALTGGDRGLAERLAAGIAKGPEHLPARRALAGYCGGVLDADADKLVAAAVELAEIGRHLLGAKAAEHAATLYAAADRPERARSAAELAVNGYRRLSADGELDRAKSELRGAGVRLGVSGTRRRPKCGLDSLTPTERRIAALVADGRSNPDIARVLVVSPRTVQFHVSAILRKLDVHSRVEIAAQLARASGTEPVRR